MEMVTLKSFDNYFVANIALSKMQQEGVPCFLLDENTITMGPFLNNAVGGIKLVVSSENAERARLLLSQFEKEYLQSVACPRCGKHEITLEPKKETGNYITAILSWMFSGLAVSVDNVYRCGNCGYESAELPVENSINN